MLFLALTWSWTAKATVVTIGTGTTTHNSAPIANYFNYSLAEMIFTAEEISAGNPSVSTILSLGFEGAAASSKTYEVTIYMKNVDAVSFIEAADFIPVSTSDVVFTGSIKPKAGWNTLDLDVPFTYDNTKSLLVVVNKTSKSYDGSTSIWKYTSTSSTYKMLYAQKDSDPAYDPTTSPSLSLNYERPNVQLTFGAPATCPKPMELNVNSTTTNSAILSWTEKGSATAWQICVNNDEDHLIDANANPFTISGLTPATSYSVKVRANCGGEQSAWSNAISFVTDCEALTIDANHPFSENFDGLTVSSNYTAPSSRVLPLCWNAINVTTYSSYQPFPTAYYYSSTDYAHSAPNCLKFYSYYSSWSDYDPQPQYAILPEMNDLDGKQLVLYARGYNASSSIIIGRMTDPSDASTFSLIAEQTLTATYAEYEFNLAGVNGDYIAIKIDAASSSKSSNGAYIDDIVVRNVPSCLKPTELAVNSISTNSAELSWNANSGETEWKLFYKKANEENFTEVDNVTENPYTLGGLAAATAYQFYVQAVCGASDESEASDIAKFVTACDAINTLPWSEKFDSYSGASSTSAPAGYPDDELPICWQFLNRSANTTEYPQVFISSNSGYPVSGNCLFFKSSVITPLYAILPEFVEDIAGLQLTFTYRNEGTSDSNGTLHIGYMTNPSDTSTFTSVLECPRTTTLTEKEVLFASAPAGSFIAFKYQGGTSSNYYLSIDNVSVDVKPSCLKPSALMLETPSSRTAHTATLKWTKGEESQSAWEIAYSKLANFNPDEQITDSIASADSNPFTLSGLEQSTTYYAYVRANCGIEDGKSAWSSNKASFTTLSGHQALSNLALVDGSLGSQSAEVNWKPNAANELHANYELYYSQANSIPANDDDLSDSLVVITDTFYVFNALTPETTYYVWVRDNCGTDGKSAWSSVKSFTTTANCPIPEGLSAANITANSADIAWTIGEADNYIVQYRNAASLEAILSEDFENETSYNANWKVVNMSTANASKIGQETSAAHSGSYGFRFSSYSSASTYEEHLINKNELTGLTNGVIEFYFKKSNSSAESFKVGYSSTDNETTSFTFGENHEATQSWQLFHEEIPAGTKYVSIQYTTTSCNWYLYIDDIVIGNDIPASAWQSVNSTERSKQLTSLSSDTKYEVRVQAECAQDKDNDWSDIVNFTTLPSCVVPSALKAENVTESSADLSWTENGTATAWTLYYKKSSDENYEGIPVTSSSHTLDNLDASSSYMFYVVADCSSTDHSDESAVFSFDTECGAVALPFNCEFNAASDLQCWTMEDCETTTGISSGSFAFYWTYNPPQYLISPELAAGENLVKVQFDYKAESANYPESFEVGYSTTDNSISSFTWGDEVLNVTKTTYQSYSIVCPAGTKYVSIKCTSEDKYYLYIDNFSISELAPYSVTINASRYATFYSDEAAYVMPQGLIGYAFTIDEHLSDPFYGAEGGLAPIVPAGTPLVLEGNAGTYSFVPSLAAGTELTLDNDLHGVNEATIIGSASDGKAYYVLSMNGSNDPESVGFYYMLEDGKGGFELPAHKAYLVVDNPSLAPSAFFLIDENQNATWLENLQGVEGTVKFMHEGNIYILRDSIIYDATGRKVRELK